MYIVMNRFRIILTKEQEFIDIWKDRESFLKSVPGFKQFNLLQGESDQEGTLFASHVIWESAREFEEWTKSEAFRKAHANAGANKELYLGPPKLEKFEAVGL